MVLNGDWQLVNMHIVGFGYAIIPYPTVSQEGITAIIISHLVWPSVMVFRAEEGGHLHKTTWLVIIPSTLECT